MSPPPLVSRSSLPAGPPPRWPRRCACSACGAPAAAGGVHKRGRALTTICPFIVANELCERLCYYGLTANFVLWLGSQMGFNAGEAAIVCMLFDGTAYLAPLAGAHLADAVWGRYRTIALSQFLYLAGMVAITVQAWVPGLTPGPGGGAAAPWQLAIMCTGLALITLATGGIKANSSTFGADQFDISDPQDAMDKDRFFGQYYLACNLGSIIATTAVVYVQQAAGWGIGFALCTAAMAAAALSFMAGYARYSHAQLADESPMALVWQAVSGAVRFRLTGAITSSGHKRASASSGVARAPSALTPLLLQPARQGGAASGTVSAAAAGGGGAHDYWLARTIGDWYAAGGGTDATGRRLRPTQLRDVQQVVRLLPVCCCTILYWTLYGQMSTMFISQGNRMDQTITLPLVNVSFQLPCATMSLFDSIAVMALVPLYEGVVAPALRRWGCPLSMLTRLCLAQVLVAGAMVYMALLERTRLAAVAAGAPPLSILWQAGGYALVGASEVFASVTEMEFFYDQAPEAMRSSAGTLGLLNQAFAAYAGSALLVAVQWGSGAASTQWLPDDLDAGRLDLFLLLLAGIMVLNLGWFTVVASRYRYVYHGKEGDAAAHIGMGQAIAALAEAEDHAAPSMVFRAGTLVRLASMARAGTLDWVAAARAPPHALQASTLLREAAAAQPGLTPALAGSFVLAAAPLGWASGLSDARLGSRLVRHQLQGSLMHAGARSVTRRPPSLLANVGGLLGVTAPPMLHGDVLAAEWGDDDLLEAHEEGDSDALTDIECDACGDACCCR